MGTTFSRLVRRLASCAAALCALGVLVGPASAQPILNATWLDETTGLWFDPARWDIGQAPNNNAFNRFDVFIGPGITNQVPFVVSLDQNATIESLTMTQSISTLDLTVNALTLQANLSVTDSTIMGTLGGGATLSVAGSASFTRAMLMWFTLDTLPGSELDFPGGAGATTVICDTDVNHRGAGRLSGDGELVIMGGSIFSILPGGTFDLEAPSGLITGAPGGGGTPELVNAGRISQSLAVSTSITGIDLFNTGTLDVSAGTLSTDGVALVGGLLDSGVWRVSGGATLDLLGASILTNAATIEIDGPGSTFTALDTIQANAPAGALRLTGGRELTTAGDFTNDGVLAVGDGSTLTVAPGSALTNFAGGELSGGRYEIGGTLRFDGADIASLNGAILLDGPGAAILDQGGLDGLRNLSIIAPQGDLTLRAGRELTTSGDLTVAQTGRLGVDLGSTFTVPAGSTVTNFAAGTFTGGVFDIRGTLVIDAAVETLAGDFTLDGPVSTIVRPGGGDVFETLSLIDTQGALTLRNGRTLSVLGNVQVAGSLTVESGPPDTPSRLIVPNDLVQGAGVVDLRQGGVVEVGGMYNLAGGVLRGSGLIDGRLVQTGGTIEPGSSAGTLAIGADYTLQGSGMVRIELAGVTPGLADLIDVAGALRFGTPTQPLGGILLIDLIDGYIPSPAGDTFEIIRSAGRTGQFVMHQGPIVGGQAAYEVFYTPTSVWVTVYAVPAPPTALLLLVAGIGASRRRR